MYLRCPRQYEFRYVYEIKVPPGAALIKGKAYDFVCNANYTEKIKTGKDLKDGMDFLPEGWRAAMDDAGGEVDWGSKSAVQVSSELVDHAKLFFAEIAPQVHPVAVQVEVRREGFLGYIDVVDDETRIRDNKAKSKLMGANEAHKDLQPTAYAYAMNTPIEFVFDVTTPKKAGLYATERDMADVKAYQGLLDIMRLALETGIFPPNPTSNMCSPNWCGYWDRCDRGGTRWFTPEKEADLTFTG
jgi:hypothetical protein